jgi:DNA-binding LacI/PurR family transcriptional regulator
MALAVCMLFDATGERVVRGLWERLEQQGIRSLLSHTHGRHHPHVSYVVLRSFDQEAVRDAVEALPDSGPFTLSFHGLVVFPRGRVCAVPALTSDVVRRQEQVEQAARDTGADVHKHYQRRAGSRREGGHRRAADHAERQPRSVHRQLHRPALATFQHPVRSIGCAGVRRLR